LLAGRLPSERSAAVVPTIRAALFVLLKAMSAFRRRTSRRRHGSKADTRIAAHDRTSASTVAVAEGRGQLLLGSKIPGASWIAQSKVSAERSSPAGLRNLNRASRQITRAGRPDVWAKR
jgi:hypothetical protein